ncbi:DUF2330 domain-containing protein [Oscillochloris sp. ZM17-4]|uniref:DUF2330 domain-containing protein n=1 Tax=Oscillochloris sp. ZM17-4 TaxID=2866714 RepID=UPI001C72FC5F|nr:DUF2330 domain-containing protein [Oscillochloris sp. ZM17-4]MBX0327912.1 DUF2330 domain-containing protein [Oscillochloris sp. ZM17-4]
MLRPYLMVLGVILALAPGAALACGMPLGARITFERALLIDAGPRKQLITTVDLSDADPDAAVIFPVPAAPTVDQPAGGDGLFPYLIAATQPLVEQKSRYVWRLSDTAGAGAPPGGVSVLGRETLGGYDVARLSADDPAALQTWLDQNGYRVPAAAAPILAAYVGEGWKFVAVKLSAGDREGALSPLRISYQAEDLIYPMRLGSLSDRPVGVELFVLSDHRSELPALSTTFAGPLSSLDPAPTGDLAELLSGAPYLTRMRSAELDPASLTDDFTVGRAASDDPYREAVTVYTDVSIAEDYAIMGIFLCLAAFSPVSFLLALAIRRRIRALAPAPEDP